ncbi:MAG: PEP-CTERM sorting domain-containing protein [Thiobacillus sp.]|nr:PEP-CTERM sorting domain-containing protein [Thiobacillus sp.]
MLRSRYRRAVAAALPTLGLAALGLAGSSTSALALNIDPSFTPQFLVNTNPALNADDVESLTGFAGQLALVYKQDAGGPESGNAAAYYSTSFNGDLSGGTITWSGSSYIVCPTCYLVVKDGNNNPSQYIFTINGWNGQDPINLSGFWPANGSISHVAIFNTAATGGGGGTVAVVPEADTYAMLLAGLGLVGFAARRRLG